MIRSVFRVVIPKRIRSKYYMELYQYFEKEILKNADAKEELIEDSMPHMDVSERHIANLRVVLNREILLTFMPIGRICAEVGVWRGDFTSDILSVTKPIKMHLIDWWAGDLGSEGPGAMDFVKNRFREEIASEQVVVHQGLSVDKLEEFPDEYFDWIYLDTDHSYETTSKELNICLRKVKESGIIAGHDYSVGSWKAKYRYGVVEAVNEFCVENDWEMILLTHEQHRHLSYALRRIK